MKLLTTFIGLFTFCVLSIAHEGHDTPGVLPIPPNGGKLGEAVHKGDHKHAGEEKELFFEAVYKKKELKIFPLVLEGKKMDTFVGLSPKKDLSQVTVKIEMPRSKKQETLKPAIGKDAIVAKFDPKRAYRFFVHVSAIHDKEVKTAKIQIEKR